MQDRKRIWGWFFFDWASQPYHTVLLTFVFGPFITSVAAAYLVGQGLEENIADADAQSMWSFTLTIIGLLIGIGAPILGAIADQTGRKLRWLCCFSVMYVIGSAALWYTYPDASTLWWMFAAFGFGFIGAEFALIFTNSQLPSLGDKEDVGQISGSGFAFGYVGGLVMLAIALLLFVEQNDGLTLLKRVPAFGLDAEQREGTRIIGPMTAIWYVVFMIPYFAWVREEKVQTHKANIGDALRQLGATFRKLRGTDRQSTAYYLGSSMFYRDGLNGLYGFGGVYAGLVLDWDLVSIGVFGVVAGIAAAFFSWIGGKFDKRLGPKPVIKFSIWVLIFVCFTIVNMSRETFFGVPLAEGSGLPDNVFLICGMLIGGMGGVLQAASRSLMVRHTEADHATEFFGLYGLVGRATAFLAPALITIVTELTQSARIGVSPIIGLFVIGLLLLRWVHPNGDQGYVQKSN